MGTRFPRVSGTHGLIYLFYFESARLSVMGQTSTLHLSEVTVQ